MRTKPSRQIANGYGLKKRGSFHVIKNFWNGICSLLSDVSIPKKHSLCNDDYNRRNGIPNMSTELFGDGMMASCLKRCPKCNRGLPIDRFIEKFTNQEFPFCDMCRDIVQGFDFSGINLNLNKKTSTTNNHNSIKQKNKITPKPNFYYVRLQENIVDNESLISGETYTTWNDILNSSNEGSKKHNNYNKKKPPLKNNKNNRKKTKSLSLGFPPIKARKGKSPPWKYACPARSNYEKELRREYEFLWRAGKDMNIPIILFKTLNWEDFWNKWKNTPFGLSNLNKELKGK